MESTIQPGTAPRWDDLYARYCAVMDELARRLERITAALSQHDVPYALIGGQAVILWVSTVNPHATRTTKDIDILLRREDLPRAKAAAAAAGFDFAVVMGVSMFIEKENPQPSSGVHILWANEIVRPGDPEPAPAIEDATLLHNNKSVVSLRSLVRMKLTAYRLHDQVHLKDLQQVGLIDASWCAKFPPVLAERLQRIIDLPEA